jgi:hypothetical protein
MGLPMAANLLHAGLDAAVWSEHASLSVTQDQARAWIFAGSPWYSRQETALHHGYLSRSSGNNDTPPLNS